MQMQMKYEVVDDASVSRRDGRGGVSVKQDASY